MARELRGALRPWRVTHTARCRFPSGRPACSGSKRPASPVSCTPFPPAIVGLPAGLGRSLVRFPS
jgi:hypothetical protein